MGVTHLRLLSLKFKAQFEGGHFYRLQNLLRIGWLLFHLTPRLQYFRDPKSGWFPRVPIHGRLSTLTFSSHLYVVTGSMVYLLSHSFQISGQ